MSPQTFAKIEQRKKELLCRANCRNKRSTFHHGQQLEECGLKLDQTPRLYRNGSKERLMQVLSAYPFFHKLIALAAPDFPNQRGQYVELGLEIWVCLRSHWRGRRQDVEPAGSIYDLIHSPEISLVRGAFESLYGISAVLHSWHYLRRTLYFARERIGRDWRLLIAVTNPTGAYAPGGPEYGIERPWRVLSRLSPQVARMVYYSDPLLPGLLDAHFSEGSNSVGDPSARLRATAPSFRPTSLPTVPMHLSTASEVDEYQSESAPARSGSIGRMTETNAAGSSTGQVLASAEASSREALGTAPVEPQRLHIVLTLTPCLRPDGSILEGPWTHDR